MGLILKSQRLIGTEGRYRKSQLFGIKSTVKDDANRVVPKTISLERLFHLLPDVFHKACIAC